MGGNFFALSRSRCLRAGSVRARYIFMDAIVHRRKRSHVAIWIQNGRQHRQKLNVCSPAPTPVQPRIRFRSAAFCFRFPKRFRLALFRMPFRSMPFFARGGLRAQEGHRVQSSGGREVGRSLPTECFWWRLRYRNPSHPHPLPPSPFPPAAFGQA